MKMYFANDRTGNRIYADEADKKEIYRCPVCGGEVIPRQGEIKAWHFAHKGCECTDSWNYDMSEWHKKMQSYFNPKNREVVVKNNGKTHRADILRNGVVVEFQHSPISVGEFRNRNRFYIEAGYRVVWVFDLGDRYDSGQLYEREDSRESGIMELRWNNPIKALQYAPAPQDNDKKISICVSFMEYEDDDEELIPVINKVSWSSLDEWGKPDYRYFNVNDSCGACEIELNDKMNMNQFFYTEREWKKYYLKGIDEKDINKKVCGIKGLPEKHYVCPRKGGFGVDLDLCEHCRYCAFKTHNYKKMDGWKDKYQAVIYCCYPKEIRETVDGLVDYECGRVREIETPFFDRFEFNDWIKKRG